jgi:hypothetical protein
MIALIPGLYHATLSALWHVQQDHVMVDFHSIIVRDPATNVNHEKARNLRASDWMKSLNVHFFSE